MLDTKIISDLRGKNFKQELLPSYFINSKSKVAGQKLWIKLLLILFISGLSSFLVGKLSSLIGSSIGLEFVIGQRFDQLISIIISPLLLMWLFSAIFAGLIPSLWVVGLGILVIAVAQQSGVLPIPPDADVVVLYTSLLLIVAIAIICFVSIRFALALAMLVLGRCKHIQTLSILGLVMVAALMPLPGVFHDEQFGDTRGDPDLMERQERFIAALPTVKVVAVSSTVLLSACLALGAWYANHRRRVPWHHPDLFRDLTLSIASWKGTSFYDLDLSEISFSGTQLANCDLRARKLYRTNFQGTTGLKRARVDSRYLDLEIPKVQRLLTQGSSGDTDYTFLNLQGAFLQGSDLRQLHFIDTNLNGADLSEADLRGAILARTQVIGADFSNANLTGICIKDWSVNDQTLFTNVRCDYVYRELDDKNEPTDRYPADRNFEPQEFESLYQEIGNVAELVFKEGVNWRAFSFSLQKLDLEDEGLGLELKGFERRGDRWVVRVTHNQHIPKQDVETRLLTMYEEMKGLLVAKEEQINQLLGIASDQAESIKELSQKPFGNSFFITGSTITNLTGSGNIEYTEAAQQVREMVVHGRDRQQLISIVKPFVQQLKQQNVAATGTEQLELMQQLIVAEANADKDFQAYLLQERQHILQAMTGTPLTNVIEGAIAQLIAQLNEPSQNS